MNLHAVCSTRELSSVMQNQRDILDFIEYLNQLSMMF